VLLDRERRHHDGRNAGETEPVFSLDALQRLKDLVADSEVDMKLYERSTKPRRSAWSTA
jgi:hypothetical protein